MTPSLESIKRHHRRDYVAELRVVCQTLHDRRLQLGLGLDAGAHEMLLEDLRRLELQRRVILDQLEARGEETRAGYEQLSDPELGEPFEPNRMTGLKCAAVLGLSLILWAGILYSAIGLWRML